MSQRLDPSRDRGSRLGDFPNVGFACKGKEGKQAGVVESDGQSGLKHASTGSEESLNHSPGAEGTCRDLWGGLR